MRSSWLLLISAALAAGSAYAWPQGSTEIQFDINCEGRDVAELVERVEISGNSYQMIETSKGKGIFAVLGNAKRTSRGSIEGGILKPVEFSDERSGRATARAWFDWKAKTVTMQHTGDKGVEEMPPNTQDRVSYLLAVALMPGHNKNMKFSIFDGKGQSRHEYDVDGNEKLQTPFGEFNTVKIVRRYEPGAKDRVEVWLAVEPGYLPVRVVNVDKDGRRCEHVAKRISRQ
jgi:Protein of unknown function (DUF3108)